MSYLSDVKCDLLINKCLRVASFDGLNLSLQLSLKLELKEGLSLITAIA